MELIFLSPIWNNCLCPWYKHSEYVWKDKNTETKTLRSTQLIFYIQSSGSSYAALYKYKLDKKIDQTKGKQSQLKWGSHVQQLDTRS
jgi:hypothetical protein